MSENQTTMRVNWKTKMRFRKHARVDRESDESLLSRILDKVDEQKTEIKRLEEKLEAKR